MLMSLNRSGYAELRDPFEPLSKTSLQLHSIQIFRIQYARATELAHYIADKNNGLLTSHGSAGSDDRTNQLWVRDTSKTIQTIGEFIRHMDVPSQEVLIKTRILTVDGHFLRSLGIFLKREQTSSSESSNSSLEGGVVIPMIRFTRGNTLDITLKALERNGHARILSSPELVTRNHHTASIESGEEIPYQERTGVGNTSVTFKKATLRLKVTPVVFPKKHVLLQLEVNQDKISSITVNGIPAIRTQQLTTEIVINDQETAILGGIYENSTQQEEVGIPFLKNIPVLGALFRQNQRIEDRRQLLILVTPRIIDQS